MILVVDMGNTRIKWRVTDGLNHAGQGFIASDEHLSVLGDALGEYRNIIQRVLVASVLSQDMEERFLSWCADFLKIDARFVRAQAHECGVYNGYDEPKSLGVDRWLALIAGFNRVGKACVIVSCGTAVTVDMVSSTGVHIGGYIAPGVNLILGSLNRGTHLVRADFDFSLLRLNPGRNTQAATHGAVAAMLTGLVKNALTQLSQFEEVDDVALLVSGGDGKTIATLLAEAKFIPDLVLEGLTDIALQTLK